MNADVVIVGAGPAGIFTALELLRRGTPEKIVMIEQGQAIEAAARARASTIVADGEKRALAIVEDAKAQAQVEADRIIESAKAEADVQVQRARDQLRDQVADLAVQGAEQILAREVDKTVHAQLLDQLRAKL